MLLKPIQKCEFYDTVELGRGDSYRSERGLSENPPNPGGKAPIGSTPIALFRRRVGGFSPNPEGARRISCLTVSKSPCGHQSTAVFFPGQTRNPTRAAPDL